MSEFKEIQNNFFALNAPFDGVPFTLNYIQGKETILGNSGTCSTPDSYLLNALGKAKVSPSLHIHTHGHITHFGGNAKVKTAFLNTKLAIQTKDAAWAENNKRHNHELYRFMPNDGQFEDAVEFFLELCGGNYAVDIHLDYGDSLEFTLYCFLIFYLTDHSPGYITLFDETHKLTICGDFGLGWRPEVAKGTKDQPSVYCCPNEYLQDVEMSRSLEVELYCNSHFGILDKQAIQAISEKPHNFVSSFDRWSLEAHSENEPNTLQQITALVASNIPSNEFAHHFYDSTQAHVI